MRLVDRLPAEESSPVRARRRAKPIGRDAETTLAVRSQRLEAAEMRRAALRELLDRHSLTCAQLARMAGFSNGNLIYNFLHGTSASLSAETVVKLGAVIPDLPAAMLMGLQPHLAAETATPDIEGLSGEIPADLARHLARTSSGDLVPARNPRDRSLNRLGIEVRMEACAGVRFPGGNLPVEARTFVGAMLFREWAAESPFGVRVRAPGAEDIYPDDTVLVCLPLQKHYGDLTRGTRVILTRTRDRRAKGPRTEVTVRELVADKGRLHLALRSGTVHEEQPEYLPRSYKGEAWSSQGHTLRIVGLVALSMIPEVRKKA